MNLFRQLPDLEVALPLRKVVSTVQSSYETKKGWSTEVAILFLKKEFTEFLVKNREPEIFMIHGPQKIMEDGHLK